MSSFHIRPRFEQIVDLDPETVHDRILKKLDRDDAPFEVKKFPGFICLRIQEEDRHLWSPRLMLAVDATEDGKTQVVGVYGPNANVWSMFLYGYLLTGSIALFTGVFAVAQWTIGHRPWVFWLFGIALAAVAALYFVAQFGQKLGVQQTFVLHQAYESAIGTPVEIH